MDQPRSRGLAALVIFALFPTTLVVGDETVPPASGVGAAVALEVAPSDTAPIEDPTALADRIRARLDAAASTDVAAESSEGDSKPLPAPRATGSPLIDRFDPSRRPADSTDTGADADPLGAGWWNSAEFRVGLLLASFVGLAILARRWSNTRGPRAGRPSGVLSVLARYPFGRGASLVLLEVGPRVVLVHQQGGRGGEVRPVAEFSTPEEIAEIRTRLGLAQRAEEPGFGRDLQDQLGLYDRRGRPTGFGGPDGLPLDDAMETVDLTRRRPRRGTRTN